MSFINLAAKLVQVRKSVETKIDEDTGKPKRRIGTPTANFMKEICALIPSDLLLSTNIFWSPKMMCRSSDAQLTRFRDVEDMTSRVLLWFECKIPAEDDSNTEDLRALMHLKEWFEALRSATRAHLQEFRKKNETEECTCCSCCTRGESCEICSYCCFYGCYTCGRCMIEVEQQYHFNQGVADAASGGGYSGGAVGVVTGEFGGFFQASSNQMCHDWCKGTCGADFANICCYCTQSDQGTAAAVNGGSAPGNCCGAVAFHSAKCVESTRDCYCSCFKEIGNVFCSCTKGLFDIMKGLFEGIAKLLGSLGREIAHCHCCSDLGHIFDINCGAVTGCFSNINCSGGNCDGCNNCGDCGDGCVKGVLTFLGIGCGAGGVAYDAVGGSSDSEDIGDDTLDPTDPNARSAVAAMVGGVAEHVSRRLGNQSSSEYIPSIVFMIFVLLVFAPRVLSNLMYSLLNIKQGINYDRNVRVFVVVVFFALPLSILVGGLVGASRWTFTTLAFLFMHFSYRIVALRHKRVHPELSDLSYFSCAEWRSMQVYQMDPDNRQAVQQEISDAIAPLLLMLSKVKNEEIRLTKSSFCLKGIHLFYPAINKFIARVNLSGEIKAAHTIVRHISADSPERRHHREDCSAPSAPPLAEAVPLAVAVEAEIMDDRGDGASLNKI